MSPKNDGFKDPFRPNAKQTLTSFYEVPIDVIEDAEVLTLWATKAVEK
jgi:DNA transformation protein and related proteins